MKIRQCVLTGNKVHRCSDDTRTDIPGDLAATFQGRHLFVDMENSKDPNDAIGVVTSVDVTETNEMWLTVSITNEVKFRGAHDSKKYIGINYMMSPSPTMYIALCVGMLKNDEVPWPDFEPFEIIGDAEDEEKK